MDLVDPPTIGGKFSWINRSCRAMSRFDRLFLSDKFIVDWKVEGQSIGERDVSDHAQIWIKDNKRNWGPKPFRFNNLWFDHDSFFNFVELEWKKMSVKGRGDYCLVEKLKVLKGYIAKWNKDVFGWIDLKIDNAGKEMNFLDNQFAHFAGNVPEEMVLERSRANIEFWDNLNKKECLIRKKSRQLWLSKGECNTGFFHNSLKDRRRRNSLCTLDSRRGRLEEVSEVKHFIFNHFKSFYKEEVVGRQNLSGLSFKELNRSKSIDLERLFTKMEIKEAIWACDELIPKNTNPQNIGEYRPICLVGSIYKILAKILAARLKVVIGSLISYNQTAFVPDMNMMDGFLLVNEIIDWSRRNKKKCLLLKVEFKKAYDSVSWEYIREMIRRMGFGVRWMKWMEACIFTSHMSVLVNGSATKDFKVQKGLRQGDPLSPFLFVPAIEGEWLFNSATAFISCKKGGISFKLLGILVGESPRKKKVWAEFTLSFYKAPGKVLEEIRRLQSNFLLSGKVDKKSIHWVNWDKIYKPKKKGGLGVRDVREVNKALILKWKWRILKEDNAIWSRFVLLRYHYPELKVQAPRGEMCCKDDSIWWRDINNNDLLDEFVVNGFSGCYKCNCKNEKDTLFWHNFWLGDQSLRESFPELFDMSTIKNCAVADLMVLENGRYKWTPGLLFGSSGVLAAAAAAVLDSAGCARLCTELDVMQLNVAENDGFSWCINSENDFKVASISNIVSVSKTFAWAPNVIKLLKVMWNLKIPPKMKVFAPRFFVGRIPSNDNLLKRGMTNLDNLDFVFCGMHLENFSHLFFNCHIVKDIWKSMYG
ncbi:uncharacterized protein LOC131632499 [Vicia villosa]|uniref:uncharacterized protein LOC131632499 n=1 Tax=Vicia villosa TaxID=3911 RepID=UPI00273B1A82|nr:uncharacterized protein LOC131632499 [Vicia villosa]